MLKYIGMKNTRIDNGHTQCVKKNRRFIKLKFLSMLFIMFMSIISIVSAHTGNDAYDHYMTMPEFIIGSLILLIGIIILIVLIKRNLLKKGYHPKPGV